MKPSYFENGFRGPYQLDIVDQPDTAYSFVLADTQRFTRFTNAGAINATLPPNSAVPFAIGRTISCTQYGAGAVTLVPGAGVTINSVGGLVSNGQFSVFSLTKVGPDEWEAFGDFSGGGGGGVTTFNGRAGAVVPAANDYSFADLSAPPTTLAGYGITDAVPAALTSGRILVGSAGNLAAPVVMSGDATISNAGAVTVSKSGGAAFGSAAFQASGAFDASGAAAAAQAAAIAASIPRVNLVTGGASAVGVAKVDFNATFGAITALTGTAVTQAVVGLLTTDQCHVECVSAPPSGYVPPNARVSAADTLELYFTTSVAVGIVLGALNFRLTVIR